MFQSLLSWVIRFSIRAKPHWTGCQPSDRQRIYFANHTSHLDTPVLQSAFPYTLHHHVGVAAALDAWGGTPFKKKMAQLFCHAVFIDRHTHSDPTLFHLRRALDQGQSLIFYPVGTRSLTPQPFKGGLHTLFILYPHIEFIPVYLYDIQHVLPKGHILPNLHPCSIHFGSPLTVILGETREEFLARAQHALLCTNPSYTP